MLWEFPQKIVAQKDDVICLNFCLIKMVEQLAMLDMLQMQMGRGA
jgi:hypothetical protein